jgi:uncharacterized coiled-coil protein SlyX
VRDELEVKVAQLGARATELEQRAAHLEGNLQEANAGGDAVRAEIATLTAALAGANARVQELEAATSPTPTPTPEHEGEMARLRAELGKQLERAQSAEDRIASLEADVLAAQQGVSLSAHDERRAVANTQAAQTQLGNPTSTDVVPPAPSGDDRYDDVWSAPPAVAQPSWSEPASTEHNGDRSNNGSTEPEREADTEAAASSAAEEPDDEAAPADEDMWSLRARLAEAATRKREGLE